MGNTPPNQREETVEEQFARLLATKGIEEMRRLLSGGVAQSINNAQQSSIVQAVNSVVIQRVYQSVGLSIERIEGVALETYLHHFAHEWRALPLAGLDAEHTDAESSSGQPALDRVYVGLNVKEPRPKAARGEKPARGKPTRDKPAPEQHAEELEGRDTTPWPALAACVQHPRLVILGDPGSGKSTFLRMLAIQLSTRFTEADRTASAAPDSPAFEGPLMPVFVTLRDFAAHPSASSGDEQFRLASFIEQDLARCKVGDVWATLRRLLQQGRAIALLDGLDEIGDTKQRDAVLSAVRGFAKLYPQTRIVVTCRIAAYADPNADRTAPAREDWRLPATEFPAYTLAPFNQKQIEQFVRAWYEELKAKNRIGQSDASALAETLLVALRRSDIERLAPNPMLLTVTAIVHASNMGSLPDQRVLLYKEAVDALLYRWRQGRRTTSDADQDTVSALLREYKRTPKDVLERLWELAWDVHGKTPTGDAKASADAVADISYEALLAALSTLHPEGCEVWTAKLIKAIKLRSGLLIERRARVFTFPHRTFQEYLAAQHLARLKNWVDEALVLSRAPGGLWRIVVLLAAGTYAHDISKTAEAVPLVDRLVHTGTGHEKPEGRIAALLLAADVACELTTSKLAEAKLGDELIGKPALERLRETLLRCQFDARFDTKQRCSIGTALGRVGDTRPEIVPPTLRADADEHDRRAYYRTLIKWSTPIPRGAFPMGNDDKHGDEKPRFMCDLIAHPYAVSVYPVTVAQYRLFIKAGGYSEEADRFWTPDGLAWRRKKSITGPARYDEVFQTPNHPQVGVSWYETTAFCRWLAEVSGLPVRLPTEPEWERAARHTDAREYPWAAAKADHGTVESHANIGASKIGHTSPVGLFPDGVAECGAFDMAGNVWEWCATKWRGDYKDYEMHHDAGDDGTASRVVRGGSWNDYQVDARCAIRFRFGPYDRYARFGFRVCVSPFSTSDL